MTRKQQFLQNFLVGLFGTTAFVTLTVFSLLWVNGLSYDRATGSFEQTSVIAVEEKLKDVTVMLNGVEVADALPMQQRSLKPGLYELEISREGYRSFVKNIILQAGEVEIIENVALIAETPLVTDLPADYRFITLGAKSVGLTLSDGELYDGTSFITRFAVLPNKIYRLNHLYLYQVSQEIRLFDPETSQDFLITIASTADTVINPKPFSWSFAVKDGERNYLINLTELSEDLASQPQ